MATSAYFDALVIPDGMADAGRVRLSVQLTPVIRAVNYGPEANLETWIHDVLKNLPKARIAVGTVAQNGAIAEPGYVETGPFDIVECFKADMAAVTTSRQLWGAIFSDPGFEHLRDAIKTGGNKASFGLRAAGMLGSARTAELEAILDNFYLRHAQRTVAGRMEGNPRYDAGQLTAKEWLERVGWAALPRGSFEGDAKRGASAAREAMAARYSFMRAQGAGEKEQQALAAAAATAAANRAAELTALDRASQAGRKGQFTTATDALMANLAATVVAEFAAVLGLDEDPTPEPEPGEVEEITPLDIARRKLSALLSFPRLAKFLGLAFDLTIAARQLPDLKGKIGAIALDVEPGGSPDPMQLAWTAFELAPATLSFAPASGPPDHLYAANQFRRGLLNLGQKIGTADRYSLGLADPVNTLLRLAATLDKVAEQERRGRRSTAETDPLAKRSRRGIVVYDRFAVKAAEETHARDEKQALSGDRRTGATKPVVNYATDLVRGYRFDAYLLPEPTPQQEPAARWRSLTARTIDFMSDGSPHPYLNAACFSDFPDRDHGLSVAPVAKKTSTLRGTTADKITISDEIALWSGESMAIAAVPQEAQPIERPNNKPPLPPDLPLTVITRPSSALKLPPLRDHRHYRLRARAVWPNGCGLTLQEANLLAEKAADSVLPPRTEAGFRFRRVQSVGAPEVVLPWDSELVTETDETALANRARGESVGQIVVRSNGGDVPTSKRFLVPPRLAFDDAERQGQFDTVFEDEPTGAFQDGVRISLAGPEGALPEARAGAIVWREVREDAGGKPVVTYHKVIPGGPGLSEVAKKQSRGSVLIIHGGTPPTPGRQYHVDRDARYLRSCLRTVLGYTDVGAKSGPPIEFYTGDHFRKALPVVLELRVGGNGTDGANIQQTTEFVRPYEGTIDLQLRKLRITLAPAEMVDLELYCHSDATGVAASAAGAGMLEAARSEAERRKLKFVLSEALDTISACPVSDLHDKRVVRLVHAVKRPLRRPTFDGAGLGLNAVTVGFPAEAPQPVAGSLKSAPPTTWQSFVESLEKSKIPWPAWPSLEGGGTTFFVGAMAIHGRSTGRVRCEARWTDYSRNSVRFDPAKGIWILDKPKQYAPLFAVDDIATPAAVHTLDLVRMPNRERLQAFAYSFPDGRARKLRIRSVATSRFANFYPPASPTNAEGPYERESGSFEDGLEIWTECTFRPPPPEIDRIIPQFTWTTRNGVDEYEFSRETSLRIYLKPNWYASGEDEALGIVFHDVTEVCDFEADRLAPFGRYVTRWGRDPVHETQAVPINLDPAVVQGILEPGTFDLWPGLDDPSTASSEVKPIKVKVVRLDPTVDPHEGLYCDLKIDPLKGAKPHQSYSPFVQLGLVRLQPHCVRYDSRIAEVIGGEAVDLRLSRPVDEIVRLLPARKGEVKVINGRKLAVTFTGPIYRVRPNSEKAAAPAAPEVDARLLVRRALENSQGLPVEYLWEQALDDDGKAVGVYAVAPTEKDGVYGWSFEVPLPKPRNEADYALVIEEFELLPKSYPDPLITKSLETNKVRFGPVFSTTVNLYR